MPLSDNPLMWVLGIGLFIGSSVQYKVVELSVLDTNITPFTTWIFTIGLGGAYILSQRNVGDLSDWETGAFVVGLGAFAAYTFIPEFAKLVNNHQPFTGIILVLVTMVAFYILTNENI